MKCSRLPVAPQLNRPLFEDMAERKSYRFGPFLVDCRSACLRRDGVVVSLRPKTFDVLTYLAQHPGRLVPKTELIDNVWQNLNVTPNSLVQCIKEIRHALQDDTQAIIETVSKRGYLFASPVIAIDGDDAASSAEAVGNRALPLPDRPSIAVLPFDNMSGDPDQDYFADGISEDLITGLSRIRWLFVIARSSTLRYRQEPVVDVKQVGRELGVRYLLQGSVRKWTDRVRIACQLVEAASGVQVWSERYDRVLCDVFDLQDEVAIAVVGAIEPTLRQAEARRVRRKRPDRLDAYELVLQAQPAVFSGMPEPSTRAITLLDRALVLEPGYALAHAYAAMCHHNRFLRGGLSEADREASIGHARAAMASGQDDALALTFAGFSMGMDAHDRAAAFAAFDAALALSPSSALTYILGSVVAGWGGQAERAIEWGERGLRLSPFDAWAFGACHSIVLGQFRRGHFDAAAAAAIRAIQANPAHSISYMLHAAALAKLGKIEDARKAAATVMSLQPNFRYGRQFAGVDCEPTLAAALGTGLAAAGLQE